MKDSECVAFLQWALPHMRLHWPGFRRVRGQVCKRIDRRLRVLDLPDAASYRAYLGAHPGEWGPLADLCSIPISRFWRDAAVFESLERLVLPALAAAAQGRADRTLTCWSAGCAAGEEPYTLAIAWELQLAEQWPGLTLRILATDVDPALLERAEQACYQRSSLRELPGAWLTQAFHAREGVYCVRQEFRTPVELVRQNIRDVVPDGVFDLILCRNVVLTYFEPELQREVMGRMIARLRAGGALVIGLHEALPEGLGLAPWPEARSIWRKVAQPGVSSGLP
jgi:chemotaxis protein methyltransferase CheR